MGRRRSAQYGAGTARTVPASAVVRVAFMSGILAVVVKIPLIAVAEFVLMTIGGIRLRLARSGVGIALVPNRAVSETS